MPTVVILLIGIVIGLFLFYLILKFRTPNLAKIIPDYSESETQNILTQNGYRIIEKQKTSPIMLFIDTKSHLLTSGCDYIVEKDNMKYAVKVTRDSDLTSTANLSAFLEAKNLFPKLKLLCLELSTGQLHEIKIEFPKPEQEIFFTMLIALSIIAVIVGIVAILGVIKLY